MAALKYLDNYRSPNTLKSYKVGIKKLFASVYGSEPENGDLEVTADRYLSEGRNYEEDIQAFINSLGDIPPMTIRARITAVKAFLDENKVELPYRYWKQLRRQRARGRTWTMDKVPTNAELKKMIQDMPIQGRALYLVLASSGMRIGEVLQLVVEDLELDKDPVRVKVRGNHTKSNSPRVTFISSEAKEAVVEWLRRRQDYLTTASSKTNPAPGGIKVHKSTDDPRLFPFSETNAHIMFQNSLDKIGLNGKDPSTQRNLYHPHVLRKFFRTRMGSAIPVDIVEAMMGHEGYLTSVYRRHSDDDLAGFYKKGEHSLIIFGNGQDIAKLKNEVEEKSKILNEGMATLALKNAELENKLVTLLAENQKTKDQLSKVIALVDKLASKVGKMD